MGYVLNQALKDLHEAGLLAGCLFSQQGILVRQDEGPFPAENDSLTFQGAGLDSRNLEPEALFVALEGEQVDGRRFISAALKEDHWALTRALDEGVTDPLTAVSAPAGTGVILCTDPVKALAHLAACWRQRLNTQVVAITGTNGKTTTKDFVRALLSEAGTVQATQGNFNNHLGLPITLLNLRPETEFAVIEMGASAVGEIAFLSNLAAPDVGIITNASPAHLAQFGSLENIIEGKGELLEALPVEGTAVLNADSPGFAAWRKRARSRVVVWGQDRHASELDHHWQHHQVGEGGEFLKLDGHKWPLSLPGRHNAANLCAAVLACRSLGLKDEVLRQGLAHFQGSAHRGLVFPWRDCTILDDSYNANPGSILAAGQALLDQAGGARTLAVLGAMAELGPDSDDLHRKTGTRLAELGIDFLLAVGTPAQGLAEGFGAQGRSAKVLNHNEALAWLRNETKAGDQILLKGSRSAAMDVVADALRLEMKESTREESP